MERLEVNEAVLYEIFSDSTAKQELLDFLTYIIDEELAQGDDMDCDLIDACTDALLELQEESTERTQKIFTLLSDEKFRKQIQKQSVLKKRHIRILAVSAAAAMLLLTVGSVYSKQATGETLIKRVEKTIQSWFESENVDLPEPTVVAQTTTAPTPTVPTTSEITTAAPTTAPQRTAEPTPIAETEILPARIYGIFPENLKTTYQVGEKLDMQGVRVMVVELDGAEHEIPLTDCQVTTERGFSRNIGHYTVTVFYKGLSFSYPVTVIAQKDTVLLNSIYGTFSESFSFTVASFDNLDFSGITVTAVYSDGSEREIPIEDCEITVEQNFAEMENKALVTVNYEDTSFSFLLTKEAM